MTNKKVKHCNTDLDKNYQRIIQHFTDNIVNINLNEELSDQILIFIAQMEHYVISRRDNGFEETFISGHRDSDNVDSIVNDLIGLIETDDKTNNYTRHLSILKELTDYMQKDILANKKHSANIETTFFDKSTLSFVDKHCYDNFEDTNFYEVFTSYNHWQLKSMIKIDPISNNICFVSKDRVFELDTDKVDISLVANTNQLLKNFDINERYIVSCGIDHDRVFERKSSFIKDENTDNQTVDDFSEYIPGTNINEANKGIVSITNRENSRTAEVKLGKLLNNDISIIPSENGDLKLMTVNNDGFLYKFSIHNNEQQAEKINLINKSLNTIDLSNNGKIAGISTDESYTILVDTDNLNKQLKIIRPRVGNDISSTVLSADDLKYNMSKLDRMTPSSSGRYGFGTRFSPYNSNEFTTIFQNGLIQFYDIRNMNKPIKEIVGSGNTMGSQLRGLCYDSRGRVYVSQECGVVHCIDPNTSSDSHEIINLPHVTLLRESMMPDNLYLKDIMPFVSTTDDVFNLYKWFEERIGVITSNRYFSSLCKNVTLNMNKRFEFSFFNYIKPNQISNFKRILSLKEYSQHAEKERKILSEHEEAHLESMTWNLPRNKRIENMRLIKRNLLETVDKIGCIYPEVYNEVNKYEDACYADVVKFDKLVASDVQCLNLSTAQDAYLDVIKRDQKLSQFYNHAGKKIGFHQPKVGFANGQNLTISEATTLGTEFIRSKDSSINLLEPQFHDDIRMPSYKPLEFSDYQLDRPFSEFLIDEYKNSDATMNMEYIPKITADNGITGLNVRQNGNREELVIGVGTGIYTIPL